MQKIRNRMPKIQCREDLRKYLSENKSYSIRIDKFDELFDREKLYCKKFIIDFYDEIINELYDTSSEITGSFNLKNAKRDSFIIRKLYGAFDYGVCQTHENVANYVGLAPSNIFAIKENFLKHWREHLKLRLYCREENPIKEEISLSSPIEKLNLSLPNFIVLNRAGIKNVSDIISMSEFGLARKIYILNAHLTIFDHNDIDYMKEIRNKIFSLGLEFKENNFEDIIQILYLPIEYLKLYDHIYEHLKINNIATFYDLLSVKPNKYSFGQVKSIVHSLGFKLKDESLAGKLGIEDIEQIIKRNSNLKINLISLEDLNLSSRSYNALKRSNFDTLSDLLILSTDEIVKIRNVGIKNQEEIINKVHELGYKFKDEFKNNQPTEISIHEEVETDLSQLGTNQIKENNEISNRISKKEELLERYQKLIEEKQLLLEKERELDDKIAEALQTLNKLNGDTNGKKRK